MATVYDVTVSIKVRGQEVLGAPIIKRIAVDETTGPMRYEQPHHATNFVALPSTILDELQLLFIRADQAITLRLDDQSDEGIPLLADGFLLLVGADIDAGAALNLLIQNASNATASITALAAGT